MKDALIVIAGPTASGKSKLAIEVAKRFNGEIVNADSRTIYKEMDIATGKPTKKDLASVPHHLFNIVNPDEMFSLSDYKKLATKTIIEIQKRNKIPILVGGTGLYIDAVIYDFNLAETPPNLELRNKLNELPTEELIRKLGSIYPSDLENIDLNNRRRVIRTLEIALSSSDVEKQKTKKEKPENVLYLALDVPRDELYKRIEERIDIWRNSDLIEETQMLKQKYKPDLLSMTSIGYKEISDALNNKITLEEAFETMKKRTRNYAKRQLTWFRRNKDIVWVKKKQEAERTISDFLK